MNIFSQASQGLNLSPAQRAFLKLFKGWVYTALGAGLIAGAEYLMGNGQVDWQKLLYLVGGAVLLSILNALDKYFTSQGDTPLALATEAIEHRVQQAVPLTPMPVQPPPVQPTPVQPAQLTIMQPEVSSGVVAQSPQAQFKTPVPAVEHPPIEAKDMVNTLPTLPAFTSQQKQ